MKRIRKFVKPEISFDLMLSEDGSGRGAALVAAVACREEGRLQVNIDLDLRLKKKHYVEDSGSELRPIFIYFIFTKFNLVALYC